MTKNLKTILILIAILFAGILAVFGIGAKYFSNHFLPRTSINGIAVGGKTAEDVKYEMRDKVREYTLTLKERGGQEAITGDQLYMEYVDGDGIESLLKKQKGTLWLFSMMKSKDLHTDLNFTYDKTRIDSVLDQLKCLQEANVIKAENAVVEYNGTEYVVKSAVKGTEVDREKLKEAVLQAIDNGDKSLDLDEKGLYISPERDENDAGLIEQAKTLNQMTSAKITFDFKDRQKVVDRNLISTWITTDANGNAALDEGKVKDWVIAMARETDTFGLSHEFKTTSGRQIKLAAGGDYGWLIGRDKTTQMLIDAIKAGKTETMEPYYRYKGLDRSTNDIGNTYVEIDISKQRMWCYKDGQLIVDTPVVTGNEAAGTTTPSGSVWAVDAKESKATFESQGNIKVDYWLPFNGGCGIHDAYWRSNFGGDIFRRNGSHGCINTPHDAAGKIFDVIKIGYPIIVYYSEDQVVGPAPTKAVTVG